MDLLFTYFNQCVGNVGIEADPIRSGIMERDEASFVLGVDISSMLQ